MKTRMEIQHLPTASTYTSDGDVITDEQYKAMVDSLKSNIGNFNYMSIITDGDLVIIPKKILEESVITVFKEKS